MSVTSPNSQPHEICSRQLCKVNKLTFRLHSKRLAAHNSFRPLVSCWSSRHSRRWRCANATKYIINIISPGFSGQYGETASALMCSIFPRLRLGENTCTHSCNISPHCPLNQVIRYIPCCYGNGRRIYTLSNQHDK